MKALTTAATAVVLMAMTTVHADRRPQATLTVRLYNTAGIPADQVLAARQSAAAILEDTGVAVVFRHCGRAVPGEPADACDQSLKPSEVVVRIIDAPASNPSLDPEAFGLSYVVERTNRGWLATVFADRTARAAARVRGDAGVLLGRVIAHEVGHLLLGVSYHGHAGLMRAQWPDAMLTRTGDAWLFSLGEAARIHRALTASAANRLAAAPTS
jgi:hypothetical protein